MTPLIFRLLAVLGATISALGFLACLKGSHGLFAAMGAVYVLMVAVFFLIDRDGGHGRS